MRIYWKKLGGHIHCRVFMSGSKNGNLVFDEKEWERIKADGIYGVFGPKVLFLEED